MDSGFRNFGLSITDVSKGNGFKFLKLAVIKTQKSKI